MPNDAYRHSWSHHLATKFMEDLDATSPNNFFLFIGRHHGWDDNNVEVSTDSREYTNVAMGNMIAIKRLDYRNAMMVVPRFNWTAGTAYTQYDPTLDHDEDDSEDAYYVLVDDKRVYKCIDNASGAVSTVKPTHTSVQIIETSDGYKWKYLYELTERMKEFMTDEYLPVAFAKQRLSDETLTQSIVQSQSVDGAIPLIKTVSSGDRTYEYSETTAKKFRRAPGASDTELLLSLSAKDDVGAYVGYVLYITDGVGDEVGITRRITSYNEAQKKITIAEPLGEVTYSNLTKYKILPEVVIHGDGEGARAVANVNSNNKISSITVVDEGKNYRQARIEIATTSDSGSSDGTFRAMIGPNGGHGSDAPYELNASRVMLLGRSDTDGFSGPWITENEFRQFGVVKNPVLNLSGVTNDNTIAGSEYDRITELEIQKPYDVDITYKYDTISGTYKPGNYVMGVESNAVGEVYDWKSSTRGTYSILTVKNIRGDFIGGNPLKNQYRIIFGVTTGNDFIIGETVSQYEGGTTVDGATAQGIVEQWTRGNEYNELIVLGTTGSFISPAEGITNEIIGSSASYEVTYLETKGGELIKQYEQFGVTGDYRFVTVDTDLKQNYGRVVSQGETLLDTIKRPTYRTTTKLRASVDQTYSQGTFDALEDLGITQENATSLIETTAKVFTHQFVDGGAGGCTVDFYLTDVIGSFATGSTLEVGSLATTTAISVDLPEVVLGGGEIVYIQNIRPVERSREQEEEFKILLGF